MPRTSSPEMSIPNRLVLLNSLINGTHRSHTHTELSQKASLRKAWCTATLSSPALVRRGRYSVGATNLRPDRLAIASSSSKDLPADTSNIPSAPPGVKVARASTGLFVSFRVPGICYLLIDHCRVRLTRSGIHRHSCRPVTRGRATTPK